MQANLNGSGSLVVKNISDEDVAAIFAYLKSTKPVHNVVPAPKALSEL